MSILSIASNALNNASVGTQIASKNIENVSNVDYSREQVVHSTGASGTVIVDVQRISDSFVDSNLNTANANYQEDQTALDIATNLDDIVTGLSVDADGQYTNIITKGLTDVNDAIIALSANNSSANQSALLANLSSFTDIVSTLSESVENQSENIDASLNSAVSDVNSAIADLNAINEQLEKSGSSDLSLYDQRDSLVADISENVNVNISYYDDGQVKVSMANGQDLITNKGYNELSAEYDAGKGTYEISVAGAEIDSDMVGGTIGGLVYSQNSLVNNLKGEIDKIYYTLAEKMNEANATGFTEDGTAGDDLMVIPPPIISESDANSGLGSVSADGIDVGDDPSLNFSIEVTSSGFTVTDIETGTTENFTGSSFTYRGVDLSFTGSPQVGDTYNVKPFSTPSGAGNVTADISEIAMSDSATGGAGNLGNGSTFIQAMDEKDLMNGSESIFSMTSDILSASGARVESLSRLADSSSALLEDANGKKDQLAGVSLNEENVALIEYQSAYQAAAKIIETQQKLMDSLIGAI